MRKKKCDRCKSFMLEEQFCLGTDSSEPKLISAHYCIYCGRCEYGTSEQPSETSERFVDTYFPEDTFRDPPTPNL
jgi:hypothetical protein